MTRPIDLDGGIEGLSESERRQLQEENGGARIGLANRGEPGEKFSQTNFLSMAQLSFPASEAEEIAALDGVSAVSGGLTLNSVTVSGTVPEADETRFFGPGQGGQGGPPDNIDFDAMSLAGVDERHDTLGAVTAGQVAKGEWLSSGGAREAIVNTSYAKRQGLAVGDTITLKEKRFRVVGIASAPLGGQASDIYLKLGQLQQLSGRENRVNTLYVRAKSADDVAAVSQAIERAFASSEVTDAQDLASRVGGSLSDAKDLAGKLGTTLTLVALLASFMIATLLTLSSVTKRTRELGTLKAIGWPQRKVVRQVTGESLAQGALGGVVGAVIGIAGAALVTAIGIELEASVAEAATGGGGGPGPGGGAGGPGGGAVLRAPGFGQGAVQAGSELVKLTAPVDPQLLFLAIGLALAGGLVAGAAGGLRAARLRPAEALRQID